VAPKVGLLSHLLLEQDSVSSTQCTFMFSRKIRCIMIIFINKLNQLIAATGKVYVLW
jgi:hypothetical protein